MTLDRHNGSTPYAALGGGCLSLKSELFCFGLARHGTLLRVMNYEGVPFLSPDRHAQRSGGLQLGLPRTGRAASSSKKSELFCLGLTAGVLAELATSIFQIRTERFILVVLGPPAFGDPISES